MREAFFLSPFSPLDKNGSYKNLHIKPTANDRLKQAQIDIYYLLIARTPLLISCYSDDFNSVLTIFTVIY